MNHDDDDYEMDDDEFAEDEDSSSSKAAIKKKEHTPPPSIIPNIRIPEPLPLEIQHTEHDTLKANVQAYNTLLSVTQVLWTQVNSFGKALTLMHQVERLIKLRAEIMGHPYGVSARSNAKGGIVYPDD